MCSVYYLEIICMRKIIYLFIFNISIQFSYGQQFERKIFEYTQLPIIESSYCSDTLIEKLNRVLGMIENLQSEKSAVLAKEIFLESEKCPYLYEVYSWALFRSGDWMMAISKIDSAIINFGASPNLILRRGYINLEMAELGVGIREIDGNTVYLAKNNQINYEDSIFKTQNYVAALSDFKYLADTYQDRFQEIFATGYIHQMLNNYKESNDYLSKLLDIEEYSNEIKFLIVDNYIGEKKYSLAENTLEDLKMIYPTSPELQSKFSELYERSGEQEKLHISRKKEQYFSWVPEYCNLAYSENNFNTILFFFEDNSPKQKIKKLKKINKQDINQAIDILISVLNVHANHGNGVEKEAEKLLIEIGEPVVPKVIYLMQNASSTCSVTNAASILAELKDPRGWQSMVEYLPRMENIPITLTPPNIPEQLIKFDREKGLTTLLEWIKGQLDEEISNSDNPMDELDGMFMAASIYSPLSVYKKEEIKKAAFDLDYSEKQVKKLLNKIFLEEE